MFGAKTNTARAHAVGHISNAQMRPTLLIKSLLAVSNVCGMLATFMPASMYRINIALASFSWGVL